MHLQTTWDRFIAFIVCKREIYQPWQRLRVPYLTQHVYSHFLSVFVHQICSIHFNNFFEQLFWCSGYATDTYVLWIAESCVSPEKPAPVFLFKLQSPAVPGTNSFILSRCIFGSDISARRCKAASIKQQLLIERPDVWNASLPSNMCATWACYQRVDDTWICSKTRLLPENSCATNKFSGLASGLFVFF